MTELTPLVDPEKVRARLGIPFPMDNGTRARIVEAIADSEASVAAFLNRSSLRPVQTTLSGLYADDCYPLTDPRAWPSAGVLLDDRYQVVSYVANTTDLDRFDVTFNVGIDVAGDPELTPIRQYIEQDAKAALRNDPDFCAVAGIQRVVASLSTEGQSATFEKTPATAGAAGAGLSLASLKRWRRLTLGRAPLLASGPWPYVDRIRY